jgi:hypothetical protein
MRKKKIKWKHDLFSSQKKLLKIGRRRLPIKMKKTLILSKKFFPTLTTETIKITIEGDKKEVNKVIKKLKNLFGYYIREVNRCP